MPKAIISQVPGSGTAEPTVKLSMPTYSDAPGAPTVRLLMARVEVKPLKLPIALEGVKVVVVPSLRVSVTGTAWNTSLMLVA